MKKYVKTSQEELYDVLEEVSAVNADMVDAIIKLEKYTNDSYLVAKAESLYNKLLDFQIVLSVSMDELE